MFIHSIRNLPGCALMPYRGAGLLRGMVIIVSIFPVEESFLLKEHLLIFSYYAFKSSQLFAQYVHLFF